MIARNNSLAIGDLVANIDDFIPVNHPAAGIACALICAIKLALEESHIRAIENRKPVPEAGFVKISVTDGNVARVVDQADATLKHQEG